MADKKYIMLDLDDERIASLADVISNKTAKKIINHIAENEVSEAEIARDLKIPANTVNYNIKKLLDAGLIEKTKDFSWSVKGKKVPKYKVANKKIVISPKSSKNVISVLGALVATGAIALGLKFYNSSLVGVNSVQPESKVAMYAESSGASDMGSVAPEIINQTSQMPEIWVWFLAGGAIALIIFMILNWRRL